MNFMATTETLNLTFSPPQLLHYLKHYHTSEFIKNQYQFKAS